MSVCSITNLGSCLPESFFSYIQSLLNGPVQPLLDLVKKLLTEPINIEVFRGFWQLIIYVLSFFYVFLFIYCGYQFMVSGYDSAKRTQAKSWLQRIVIMILLVNASFFLYNLALDLAASASLSMYNLIDPDFFKIIADDLPSLGLQLIFVGAYALMLVLAVFLLGIRFLIVALGVVLFPIGLFLYFFPPTEAYGKFILYILAGLLLLPFFQSIILVGSAQLMTDQTFTNMNIIVATIAFALVNILTIVVFYLALNQTSKTVANVDIGKTVVGVGKWFI